MLANPSVSQNRARLEHLVDTGVKDAIGGGVVAAEDGKPTVRFFVEVDDLQAYLRKVERQGGKTVMPPTEIPNMVTFAMFSDLDGNIIGLVKAEPTSR